MMIASLFSVLSFVLAVATAPAPVHPAHILIHPRIGDVHVVARGDGYTLLGTAPVDFTIVATDSDGKAILPSDAMKILVRSGDKKLAITQLDAMTWRFQARHLGLQPLTVIARPADRSIPAVVTHPVISASQEIWLMTHGLHDTHLIGFVLEGRALRQIESTVLPSVSGTAVAIDSNGLLWVAQVAPDRLQAYAQNPGEAQIKPILGLALPNSALGVPLRLQFDASGHLWVANSGRNECALFARRASAQNFSTLALIDTKSSPLGVAIDASGGAWVSQADGALAHFSAPSAEQPLRLIESRILGHSAGAATFDANGRLWVSLEVAETSIVRGYSLPISSSRYATIATFLPHEHPNGVASGAGELL